MKGDIKTGTIYLVVVMTTLGIAGAQLTQGLFPNEQASSTGTIVTPNYEAPDANQSNLQLYTFGFRTNVPSLAPSVGPTAPPTTTPTITPTLPPLTTPTDTPPPTATLPPATAMPTVRVPTPTLPPRCPFDSIKTPDCGACFPEVESVVCDEPVCENGWARIPLGSDPFGPTYCHYLEPINPDLYQEKLDQPNCFAACIAKPVIYLYPLEPTLIDVDVKVPGNIFISYPFYPNEGWQDVLAFPDGSLQYKNQKYSSLFFESDVDEVRPPENGIVIKKSELSEKLTEATRRLGLVGNEQKEFLDYWIPTLNKLDTSYILFSILDPIEKERVDHVNIYPKPDTFIAFIAYFKPLTSPEIDLKPLILPENPPERIGFTAVEWGGTIDN